jgi:hypothetical protein
VFVVQLLLPIRDAADRPSPQTVYDGLARERVVRALTIQRLPETRVRFKSKAQRRKFAELLVKGEITPDAYERWNRDTGRAELPEHVKPVRKKRKRKSGARVRTASKSKRARTRKARRTPKA